MNKCNCEKYNDASEPKLCSSQGTRVHPLHGIFVHGFISPILKGVNGFSLNDLKEVKVYRIPLQICHISASVFSK